MDNKNEKEMQIVLQSEAESASVVMENTAA